MKSPDRQVSGVARSHHSGSKNVTYDVVETPSGKTAQLRTIKVHGQMMILVPMDMACDLFHVNCAALKPFLRRIRTASRPSISGNPTSIMTRSIWPALADCTPLMPGSFEFLVQRKLFHQRFAQFRVIVDNKDPTHIRRRIPIRIVIEATRPQSWLSGYCPRLASAI